VFEGSPTEAVYNPLGFVHGGYAATLLDTVIGRAVHSCLQATLEQALHKTILICARNLPGARLSI
jgi:acyl-coenzyme A thioesterase PaaI-like protein